MNDAARDPAAVDPRIEAARQLVHALYPGWNVFAQETWGRVRRDGIVEIAMADPFAPIFLLYGVDLAPPANIIEERTLAQSWTALGFDRLPSFEGSADC